MLPRTRPVFLPRPASLTPFVSRSGRSLHLTASAGVAPNRSLAKIASDWRRHCHGLSVELAPQHEPRPSQAPIPVISKLGPVVVRLVIGVRDQPDALNLFVTILCGRVETERSTVVLGEGLSHHLSNQQRLRMPADAH